MSQNNGENRSLARLNVTTGEVSVQDEDFQPIDIIPYSALSGLLEDYRAQKWPESRKPIHLEALEAMPVTDDERLALQEAYNSSESITMKAFVAKYGNMDVRLWGITIYEHGPYNSKIDGQMRPGFYQPRLLIELPKDGELIVVRTGSQYLAEHIFYILRKRGWWLFDEPITYRFTAGESGALFMAHVYQEGEEGLKARLTRKEKKHAK